MSPVRLLILFTLLPGVLAPAESAMPADFAIEVILAERLPPGRAIELTCAAGCDWRRRTIECAEGEGDCRAVIAGRTEYVPQPPQQEPLPRPVSGSVCTGVTFWSNSLAAIVECEPMVTEQGRKVCRRQVAPKSAEPNAILHVQSGSPGAAAGMRKGDVVLTFNGVSVRSGHDVTRLVNDSAAGLLFKTVVKRGGVQKSLRGRLGTLLSNTRCARAGDPILKLPPLTAKEVEALRFEIDLEMPASGATFTCLRGCVWPRFATGELPPNSRVSIDRRGFSKYVQPARTDFDAPKVKQ